MMRKSFGQFETPEDQDLTGTQTKTEMPPIAGSPMPNAGIKNKTMGSVFPSKDDPSPKQFAKRQAAGKRMKQMPNKSPLGPITGGPAKSQARPQGMPQARPQAGPQQQRQQPVGTGDRWMGELWQGLTLNGQPQGGPMESQRTPGFAGGGKIGNPPVGHSSPEMDLYNKVTMELESGGVAGYANNGMVDQSREIASKGRNGDTMLMHIQPQELQGLQSLLGPVTINPETGNPEAFAWFAALPFLGKLAVGALGGGALGAGIGGIAGGKKGALNGLALGAGLGATGVAAFAGAGGAGGAAAAGSGEISKAGLAKAAASGLGALPGLAGGGEESPPPLQVASTPAPRPIEMPESPYQKIKKRREQQAGSLPGSSSIV